MERQATNDVSGIIQNTMSSILSPMFFFFGSLSVMNIIRNWIARSIAGIPNTANDLLLHPSGTLSLPQCVTTLSGILSQSRSPAIIGINVTMLVIIIVFLCFFMTSHSLSFENMLSGIIRTVSQTPSSRHRKDWRKSPDSYPVPLSPCSPILFQASHLLGLSGSCHHK